MKRFILYITFIIFILSGVNLYSFGVNFGIVMQPTYPDDKFSIISGVKLGGNINKNIFVGGALYGITLFKNSVDASDVKTSLKPTLELNYFGLEAEYYFFPESTFHVSAGCFAGWADVYFNVPITPEDNNEVYIPHYKSSVTSIIIKPSVNINLNIKSYYKISAGISYRFLPDYKFQTNSLLHDSNSQPFYFDSSNLNGFSLNLVFRFGSF